MKFICDKSLLIKELSFAQEIISSKNVISILSNILFIADNNTLIIRATDMKVNFETKIPITVENPGTITVYCDKLYNIVNSIPDCELEFEIVDNKLHITPIDKKIKFQLKSIASDKFPEFPTIKEESASFDIKIIDFKKMINQTVFAVSDDETRYFMNGVFFELKDNNISMVATDGRRLAIIKKEMDEKIPDFQSIIIPPKILTLVMRKFGDEGKLKISISDKYFYIECGVLKLSSLLIDGQFPNYQRVIPENQTNTITVNRLLLFNALKRVSLLVEQKSRRVYLEINKNIMSIMSEENDIGEAVEEIECIYSGDPSKIAINYRYLEEPIKIIPDDNIQINFTEASKAITINSPNDNDYFHIIMPMQI